VSNKKIRRVGTGTEGKKEHPCRSGGTAPE
jgi:hypothetical protein